MNSCPCGSGVIAADCCEPIISGARAAETAEQLMRARYAAYAGAHIEFILASTHPETRKGYDLEGTKQWAENSQWLGLEIVGTRGGGPDDEEGEVEFIARYREREGMREHHENSRFRRSEGNWYFVDGTKVKPKPLEVTKIGRNDPCTCGSGLKFKKCCGR